MKCSYCGSIYSQAYWASCPECREKRSEVKMNSIPDDPCIGCKYYDSCPDDDPNFNYDSGLFPTDAKCVSKEE
jgi:hypothetical protein